MSASAAEHVHAGDALSARQLSLYLVPLGLFVAVLAIAAPNGSYFPSSWGWAAIAFLWAAAIGLLVSARIALSSLETTYLGALSFVLARHAFEHRKNACFHAEVIRPQGRGLVVIA